MASAPVSWKDRVLLDDADRRFSPAKGDTPKELQPTATSPPLTTVYEVPKGVSVPGLGWGVVKNDDVIYTVKLACTLRDTCSVVGEIFEWPEEKRLRDDIATRCRSGVSPKTQECIVNSVNKGRRYNEFTRVTTEIIEYCLKLDPYLYKDMSERETGIKELNVLWPPKKE